MGHIVARVGRRILGRAAAYESAGVGLATVGLATCGLVLTGSLVPRGAAAQVSDSLALVTDPPALISDSLSPALDEAKANPFSGFETHFLSNGVKVWYKRLPDAPNASISVGVPYGWDADPRGKEELAHLTEHMLFSDHDGRTEQEIKEAIEGIGGRRNGYTTPDHTWYYVTVSKEHGGFAIEWLSRLMSPHAMDPEAVERNRQPLALEINARPREFFEHLWALLNPSWLMPRDFWRREFGMQTRAGRVYDRWASLQRITAEDLVDFYDRYYAPEAMTLTVIGDLDLSEVLDISERTFGSLTRRPAAARDIEVADPERRRAAIYWAFGPNVRYSARHKFFNNRAEDDLMALFVRDLLRRRLNQRLRYGEQKAVYGLQVGTTQRGPAGYLQIQGSINEAEYDFAEAVIEEELAALRAGTLEFYEFEADRTALVERLRGENSTAQALNFWVFRNFYDPIKHRDFPDLLSFYESVTPGEIASFAARNFTPEREVISLVRVHPVHQGVLAAAAVLLTWLTVRLVAWGLTQPVTMREIKSVARFRMPILFQICAVALIGGVGLIFARLIVFAVQFMALTFLVPADDYTIRMTAYALMLVTAVTLIILYLSWFPRKILVFPDHLRIKSLAYRCRILRPDDVAEISTRRVHRLWFSRLLFRSIPLTLGLMGPGVYLRPTRGRAYFFRTRDNRELLDVLSAWRGEPVTPAKRVARVPVPKAAEEAPAPIVQNESPTNAVEDVDYDSIGLTDQELEELLGGSTPESEA